MGSRETTEMTRFGHAALSAAALALLVAVSATAAENPDKGDVRDLVIGTRVDQLPAEGYVGHACGTNGGPPGTSLQGWSEFRRCAPEPDGLREVAVAFDESRQPLAGINDRWEGTKLAGHPVILSVLLDEAGVVRGIRAVTDPKARPYLKKKAYLLGIRVMGRYGQDGWACTEAPPTDRTPVGGLLVDRHCEKTYGNRRIVLDTHLYRTAEQHDRDFTSETRLEIRDLNQS